MKLGGIKSPHYNDAVARRRERRRDVGRGVVWLLAGGLTGTLAYWVLLSGAFALYDVEIAGLERVSSEQVGNYVQDARTATLFNVIPLGNNTLFFDSGTVRARLLADFPEIKSVQVNRELWHRIILTIQERQAIGIWCFKEVCRYVDADGRAWGNPSRSSGSLLLIVDDAKHESVDFIGPSLLKPVQQVADELTRQGIGIKSIAIPDNQFDDIWAITHFGYPIYFSRTQSIQDQAEALKVFLESKSQNYNFHPQYLDLRIAGRVYYKDGAIIPTP
ncbi:MAG: FtsQ-type POTRA domain-containing protein [Patescibacteria group bacterium]